jgi:glycosyltransferase involved in cell wall biosynthesis
LWLQHNSTSREEETALPQIGLQPQPSGQSNDVLVSAIVSTYRSQRHIAECLEDLERQTIADRLEIIVVDSGSPENEGEIVRQFQQRYSNIKYIRTEQRESVYQAWNRGIKAASGRYITNANTDDRHYENALEVMATALDNNPDKLLAYARFVGVKEVDRQRVYYYDSPSHPYLRETMLTEGLLIGPQPMWRRSAHETCGYFDEGLVVSSDEEFWLRMSQHGDLLFIDETLGEFLEHDGSVCHDGERGVSCFESTFVRSCYRQAAQHGVIIGQEGLMRSTHDFIRNWYITRLVRRNFLEKFGLPCDQDIAAIEKAGRHETTPTLSVIIYACGALSDLNATVSSICSSQDNRPELIIVGKYAPSIVVPLLAGAGCDVTVIQMAHNMGPAFARNAAYQYARADLLVFVDAGLVPDAGLLGNITAAFGTGATLAIRGRIKALQAAHAATILDLGSDPLPCALETPQFCAIRRNVFETGGGFNALSFAHEGIELAFRVFQQSGEIDAVTYRPDLTATAVRQDLCATASEEAGQEALLTLTRRFPYFKAYYTSVASLYPWSNDHVDADFYTAFNTSLILKKAAPFAAIRWAQRAVELEPLAVKACFVLGSLYARGGKYLESLSLLQRVLTLSRGDLAIFRRDQSSEGHEGWVSASACYANAAALLAQSYFKLKQMGKARTIYMHLLEYEDLFLSAEQRQSFSAIVAKLQDIKAEPVEDGLADVPREVFERVRTVADEPAASPQPTQTPPDDDQPLVSAIVSTYNSESFLRGCLEDLERQTIADRLEIIVINSGSQQNEEDIVKEFQSRYDNIKYIKTPRESIYAAWNRAVKAASGKYLTNANTDDRHRADALELMAAALDADPQVALVWADQIRTDTPNAQFEHCNSIGEWKWEDYSHERLKLGCCVGSQPMWQAGVHSEVGYFDDTLTCAGDWDMWLRIAEKYAFKHIPEFLGAYYHNANGIEHGSPTHSLYERYVVGRRYGTPYIGVIPFVDGPQYPLVSVLMAAYNDEKYVAEAIESVLVQNYRRFELIIVNDGATDSTPEIIARYKDERLHAINKPNGGLSSTRNVGIDNSKGRFIVFIDADDVLSHDYLLEHVKAFQANPTASLIYCDHQLIDEQGRPLRELQQFEYGDQSTLVRDMFRCGYPVIQPRGMLSRAAFDTIGLFDEAFLTGEDYELMTRFVKAGLRAVRLPQPLYKRRMRTGSLSRDGDPAKTPFHFAAIDRLVSTFDHTQLFPDVDWSTVPSDKVQASAKFLIGATLLAMANNYRSAGKPVSAAEALARATASLNHCMALGRTDTRLRQMLRECEALRRQIMFPTDGGDFAENVHETASSDDNMEECRDETGSIMGTSKWQA